jgi:hypothetical protein
MAKGLCPADVVQERLVGTLRSIAARATDRSLHPQPVLVLVERTDGREDQIDRGIGTMVPTSARCVPHPAHELRQLRELEALPVMIVLNQERPEGLQMVRVSPHRVR